VLQGTAPGTTSPMPGYNTPVGTPHHTAKSPAQDASRTADYNRAHFDSVFNKQQDSGGRLNCISCAEKSILLFTSLLSQFSEWGALPNGSLFSIKTSTCYHMDLIHHAIYAQYLL
jgi:hypothetical protein